MQPQDREVAKERRNFDTYSGTVANSTSSRSKEAPEKASENNQKGQVIVITG
jgi:hypothetical protein